jgi:hypothetical protein
MVDDEGRGRPTLLAEAWLGWKAEGYVVMSAAPKASRCRRLEARGIARQGHVSTLDWLYTKIIVNHE